MNHSNQLTSITLDEIGLEGLDGITIESLWKRLSVRMNLPFPLLENICDQLWPFIANNKLLEFFALEQPRQIIKSFDRSEVMDILNPVECPFTIYKFVPIESDNLRGSCQDFHTRKQIPREELINKNLQQIDEIWDKRLVIVGSQQLRESSIFPVNMPKTVALNINQYCVLERVGRSRYNGEITQGKYSISEVCEPYNFFHLRKIMLKNLLLSKQIYYARSVDQNAVGLLVHLPRFYFEFKPKHILIIEQVCEMLLGQPNCVAEYKTIREHFGDALYVTIKKLFKSTSLQQFVATDIKVPYRTIYPNATINEWKIKSKSAAHIERTIRVVQLRNSNLDLDNMWPKVKDDDGGGGGAGSGDDDTNNEGFLDTSQQKLDESLTQQAYKLIEKTTSTGMTQAEIGVKLGLSKLNSRAVVRNLSRLKLISSYLTDMGRQRTNRYILNQFQNDAEQNIKEEILLSGVDNEELENIGPMDISDLPLMSQQQQQPVDELTNESVSTSPLPLSSSLPINQDETNKKNQIIKTNENIQLNDVKVIIKQVERPECMIYKPRKMLTETSMTVRLAKRLTIILKVVKKMIIIDDLFKLMKILIREEKRMGYKDEMCKRSLYRPLVKLSTDKRIRLWEIKLNHKLSTANKTLLFLSDYSVDENSLLLLSLLEKEKYRFLLRLSNEINRQSDTKHTLSSASTSSAAAAAAAATTAAFNEQQNRNTVDTFDNINSTNKSTSTNKIPSNTPKFIRMQTLHEYLFYLVYGNNDYDDDGGDSNGQTVIPPDEAIKQWRMVEPTLNYDELYTELPSIYSTEISWKMFIPPLPRHLDYGDGWVILSDAILRFPLSIFVNVFNLNYEVTGLDKLMRHPIRRHYILSVLPASIQNALTGISRKHIYAIDEILRRCCSIGLLKFGPPRQREKEYQLIRINRYATIRNTVESAPGYIFTTQYKNYPELRYTFQTESDLTTYWHDLFRICIHTRLGKRNSISKEDVTHVPRWDTRPELIKECMAKSIKMCIDEDDGRLPGDGRGAGGLDASFFSHLPRSWTHIRYKLKHPKLSVKLPPKTPKTIISTTTLQLANKHAQKIISAKKRTEKRVVMVPVKRYVKPIRNRSSLNSNIGSSSSSTLKKRRLRQPVYDDVDKQALRQMRKLRVNWSVEEDNLLLLCRTAFIVLCPSVRKQNVTSQQIRDILHWNLKSLDKTSRACQRRIVYMLKNERHANNLHSCVQDINNTKEISSIYGYDVLYKPLRKLLLSEDDFLKALKIAFVDLVNLLKKQMISVYSKTIESRKLIIPNCIPEFRAKFKIKQDKYCHERLKYTMPINSDDVKINVLTALIHSSACCTNDKTSWTIQLCNIYKNYPDYLLSRAMAKVRNDQLISANKLSNASKLCVRYLPLSNSPYHLSITYQYMLLTNISYDSFAEIFTNIREIASHETMQDIRLTNLTGGKCLGLAEILHNQTTVTCTARIPKQMLIIDTSKCYENETYDRIERRFRFIIDYIQNGKETTTVDIPTTSTENINKDNTTTTATTTTSSQNIPTDDIEMKQQQQRHVTISDKEHKTIEFYLSPIEKLIKLDECYFHFFCLLNFMGKTFKELTIDENHQCEFNCLIGRSNLVEESVEIIKRNAGIISRISEDEQVTSLRDDGDDDGENNEVVINEFNILLIFNILINIRVGCEPNEIFPQPGEVTDHGILKLSLDVLNYDDEAPPPPPVKQSNVALNKEELKLSQDLSILKKNNSNNNSETGNGATVVDDITTEITQNELNDEDGNVNFPEGDKIHRMHDYFFLNSCKMLVSLTGTANKDLINVDGQQIPRVLAPLDMQRKQQLLPKIASNSIWRLEHGEIQDFVDRMMEENFNNENIKLGKELLEYLESKNELGATNYELTSKFPCKQFLLMTLEILQELYLIMKTGVIDVTYVYWSFSKPWTIPTYNLKRLQRENITPVPYKLMKVDSSGEQNDESSTSTDKPSGSKRKNRFTKVTINQSDFISTDTDNQQEKNRPVFLLKILPWIRINGSVNRRVIDKWLGSCLLYCISHFGATIKKISTRFNLLQPAHVRILLEYLQELECIQLKTLIKQKTVTFWSTYETQEIVLATELDTIDSVFVDVLPNAMTKMALFIGEKKYSSDFI